MIIIGLLALFFVFSLFMGVVTGPRMDAIAIRNAERTE